MSNTIGENPKTRPPTIAAGDQGAQRLSNQNIANAERVGPSVDATFKVATGPNTHVIGASGTPMASIPVFDSRLIPPGWNSEVE